MARKGPQTEEGRKRAADAARSYVRSLTPEQMRERMERVAAGRQAWGERVRKALESAEKPA